MSGNLIALRESDLELLICEPQRMRLYHSGIQYRLDYLARNYFTAYVPLAAGDVVIDVGANIGEFSLALARLEPKLHFIACEPEPYEREALTRNMSPYNVDVISEPIWLKEESIEWFSANKGADSTLISRGLRTLGQKRQATTIAEVCRTLGVNHVKLLKVEAEGAEPEVLLGSRDILPSVDYVTVACGPERGPKLLSTDVECEAIMLSQGFAQIASRSTPRTLLFAREDLVPAR